ncbi:MAG: hypothetical protein ACXIT4_12390 [Erythrobacter sp.]
MKKLVLAILLLIAAGALAVQTGYARPIIKEQVERSLVGSGMGPKRADCMARRMVDRLSLWQLYKLHRAMAPRDGEPATAPGIIGTVKRLRRSEDSEILGVVISSAALCAVRLG